MFFSFSYVTLVSLVLFKCATDRLTEDAQFKKLSPLRSGDINTNHTTKTLCKIFIQIRQKLFRIQIRYCVYPPHVYFLILYSVVQPIKTSLLWDLLVSLVPVLLMLAFCNCKQKQKITFGDFVQTWDYFSNMEIWTLYINCRLTRFPWQKLTAYAQHFSVQTICV